VLCGIVEQRPDSIRVGRREELGQTSSVLAEHQHIGIVELSIAVPEPDREVACGVARPQSRVISPLSGRATKSPTESRRALRRRRSSDFASLFRRPVHDRSDVATLFSVALGVDDSQLLKRRQLFSTKTDGVGMINTRTKTMPA
jgi:hypothetical protein